MLDGTHYIECDCNSNEHVLRFTIDLDENDEYPMPHVYTSLFLNQYRPWYARIWVALKYVFGYNCKYGHWDCTSLAVDKVNNLRDLLNQFSTNVFQQQLKRRVDDSNRYE